MIKQYKTKNNETLWEFRVYMGSDPLTNKKSYSHKRGFKSKKEATLAEARATVQVADNPINVSAATMTFEQLYDEWHEGYQSHVRQSTLRCREQVYRLHIKPYIGSFKVRKIDNLILQQYADTLAKKATPYLAGVALSEVKLILKYAEGRHYLNNAYYRLAKAPKQDHTKVKKPNFWDKKQLNTFLDSIDPADFPQEFAYFRLLAYSGMRRGEIGALTWKDISFAKSTVSITKTQAYSADGTYTVNDTKTRAGRRTLPLDKQTMAAMKNWRTQQRITLLKNGVNANGSGQLVFSVKGDKMLAYVTTNKWLHTFIEKSGVPRITMHGLRHTHASALFAANVPIKAVQVRLGHADIQTTLNIYAHVTNQQSEESINMLVAYLEG